LFRKVLGSSTCKWRACFSAASSGACSAIGADGSIILYSLANLANAFVHGLDAYTVRRFLAGVGFAGELGGSITLVAEVLPRELRGYGTMMVSAVGVTGAVVAGTMGLAFNWRTSRPPSPRSSSMPSSSPITARSTAASPSAGSPSRSVSLVWSASGETFRDDLDYFEK